MVWAMNELILIVEDEADLVQSLEYNLQQEGYETRVALNGESALAALEEEPDLVVLDLMLPDMGGIEICRRIRSNPELQSIPVLILTARGEEIDRITGFEAGADDYVVKPFCIDELILRVRAILRRSGQGEELHTDRVECGDLQVDFAAHTVHVGDEPVDLTPLEFHLLEVLLRRRGRTQSRQALLRDVWDIEADVMTRTVDTHVQRLRAKLDHCGDYIVTVRGVGYRFIADDR